MNFLTRPFLTGLISLLLMPAIASLTLAAGDTGGKPLTKAVFVEQTATALNIAEKKITRGKKISVTSPATFSYVIAELCRQGKWVKKRTYKTCVAEAKLRGYFDAPFPKKISKKKRLKVKDLTVLLGRMVAAPQETEKSNVVARAPEEESPKTSPQNKPSMNSEIPARTLPARTFVPRPAETFPTDYFGNLILKEPLPNTFYMDEVYFLEGDFTSASPDEAFVFLCESGGGCEDSSDFVEKTEEGGKHFRIPVSFQQPGNFNLGIVAGRSGQSIIAKISVLPEEPPAPDGAVAPTNLSAEYREGKTFFHWTGTGSFTRLIVVQKNMRQDYIFRQDIREYAPGSDDFELFKKGAAEWTIELDKNAAPLQNVSLTTQEMRKIKEKSLTIEKMPEVLAAPGIFRFRATARETVSAKGALTLPNGSVEEFQLGDADLSAGTEVNYEKNFSQKGIYIFEINDPQGTALVNVPVYVGEDIPLLPDFFALHPKVLDTSSISNFSTERKNLLALLNRDRREYGLSEVALSEALNSIAQKHSENMAGNNFFGHVDPQGRSPEDRRKAAKYPAGIRENLAKSTDIADAQAGLMRSPAHRAAILDPEMELVGLGLAKNDEGYLFVTQNFSATPVTAADFAAIESDLLQQGQIKRSQLSLSPLQADAELRSIAAQWSDRMAQEGFFGSKDPSGASVLDFVQERGISGSFQVHLVRATDTSLLAEQYLKQSAMASDKFRNIGFGLGIDNLGVLFMTTIYSS